MTDLTTLTPEEIRAAATQPPSCRHCGRAEGIVVALKRRAVHLKIGTRHYEAWYCPRCTRRVYTQTPR